MSHARSSKSKDARAHAIRRIKERVDIEALGPDVMAGDVLERIYQAIQSGASKPVERQSRSRVVHRVQLTRDVTVFAVYLHKRVVSVLPEDWAVQRGYLARSRV